MVSKEIQKALVETEDKMERMKLIEDNQVMFDAEDTPADTADPEMEQKLTDALAEVEAQKQRYIDRFFTGSEKEDDPPKDEPKKKSLDEILGDKGGNN